MRVTPIGGKAPTLATMLQYSDEINYLWLRNKTLAQFRAGYIRRQDVCDAEFLLQASAHHHGRPAGYACPICQSEDLRIVTWVYGEALGRASGSARTAEEVAGMLQVGEQCSIHDVEVCPNCRWNQLLKARTLTKL
ncbi:hypothetical protein CPELA_10715 [Corynebacterium pelargi]|uniref:DUF5318 domain-containing protein n=2 Tax=Corynebacterium pelargi TaxID=1471400 RepID=A0A410WBR7_9CORY|nr:hypothetical protein CPELA_10715 [Corynebacterium pelargi]